MKFRLLLLLLLAFMLTGCHKPAPTPTPPAEPASAEVPASNQTDPNAPLPTEGVVEPPPGCIALRQRGGSC